VRSLGVVLLVVAAVLFALLPPRARTLDGATPRPVRGAVHVHTDRSDGTGTLDAVARAAARAGLSFVVITDHGDASRAPDLPVYRSGVLCIDAVEISTTGGHIVALDLPQAPYPLGGEAADVVEDVHRLGGWAMAAHPGSPKEGLGWRDWQLPVDGIEWLNGDSEWRDESTWPLVRTLFTYPLRARESLAALLDRPEPVMQAWDRLTAQRPVVALAAVDAHARVGLTTIGEPYDARASVALPTYATVFSVLSVVVEGVELTQDASLDARRVLDAIRGGRAYSVIDGLAAGGTLSFSATSGETRVTAGQMLPLAGPVTVNVQTNAPEGARLTLFRDGVALRVVEGASHVEEVPAVAATYRVEVTLPRTIGTPAVPWLVSNPIYVGRTARVEPIRDGMVATRVAGAPQQLGRAQIERSMASEGAVSLTGEGSEAELQFRYALGGRPANHPYAAAVLPISGPLEIGHRIVFSVRADHPMRMSVQLRSPDGGDGDRWRQSFYLDETPRTLEVQIAGMTPVTGVPIADRLSEIDSLLFVVDALHTRLGIGGRVWIRQLQLAK
jgi:hypothetical protein